jgi:hypothetical protein
MNAAAGGARRRYLGWRDEFGRAVSLLERINEPPRRALEVHMNAFITPLWVEKPRVSPARELAGESILT